MPDEPKAIMSANAEAENKRDVTGDQTVMVKPLKTFHKSGELSGEMVGPDSPPFEVSRTLAAQFRANGLVAYVTEADGVAIHGPAEAKKLDDKARFQAERSRLPANSKTTPLRNPDVPLATI